MRPSKCSSHLSQLWWGAFYAKIPLTKQNNFGTKSCFYLQPSLNTSLILLIGINTAHCCECGTTHTARQTGFACLYFFCLLYYYNSSHYPLYTSTLQGHCNCTVGHHQAQQAKLKIIQLIKVTNKVLRQSGTAHSKLTLQIRLSDFPLKLWH